MVASGHRERVHMPLLFMDLRPPSSQEHITLREQYSMAAIPSHQRGGDLEEHWLILALTTKLI